MIYKRILIILFSVLYLSLTVYAGTFTVPDWVINSCVFIMKGDSAEGTGFLVWIKEHDTNFCYLISAKHIVEPILKNPNNPLAVRFNLKNSDKAEVITFPTFKFNDKRWLEHQNSAVDIAVIPLTIFGEVRRLEVGVHIIDNPENDFLATSDWLKKYRVGPGDQTFTMGLVPYLYTKDQKNLVLSRFGTISLLPDKEIDLPGGKQKGYFLDCQAFPGNSGGPAFVLIERSETGSLISGWRFGLLGVVTEFVPSLLRHKKINLQHSQTKTAIQLIENTGISKVVPVDYLVDILFSDSQKEFRKNIADRKKKEDTEKDNVTNTN